MPPQQAYGLLDSSTMFSISLRMILLLQVIFRT
ncbi:hypothetical protein T190_14695 [Sinorhizobium meliloti CCBAU 01290]|nr:hypothetical protein T190_14695 [Sinorhizobium meliloti CCBAU 01290]